MPWMIKREYQSAAGRPVEKTERIPATDPTDRGVCEQLTAAFRETLFQVLAEAADNESDLTVTVAYVGKR